MYLKLVKDLQKLANSSKASLLSRYFKTGKGEYGEGDRFLGIMVPEQRKLAKEYFQVLKLTDVQKLLNSKIHEFRLTALLILVEKYKKADQESKEKIVDLYLVSVKKGRVNNWDLVDLSAPRILGDYLLDKEKDVLYNLVEAKSLWERRVAVISTFAFIRENKFYDTLSLSKLLLSDREDLIHKAVGWALREVGKKDLRVEIKFLKKFNSVMPRVMLRYAIEKFPLEERKKYLKK
jgi:3-methyladenine DNA glycosylase AlkD